MNFEGTAKYRTRAFGRFIRGYSKLSVVFIVSNMIVLTIISWRLPCSWIARKNSPFSTVC